MEEKINEEFVNKDWELNQEAEKQAYKETALKLIAKAICREDLHEIKEIIEELENEIGEV